MRTKNDIGVIGYGLIGKAIKPMLESVGYKVTAYDVVPQPGVTTIKGSYDEIVSKHEGIVASTPYKHNIAIARACKEAGVAYFDLTEDVAVTQEVHNMAQEAWVEQAISSGTKRSSVWMMPQCGLAPGFVSTCAAHLVSKFGDAGEVYSVEIRVGALPVSSNNEMKYYLTWSPEGLVNEYVNPCVAAEDGQVITLRPLEGLETLNIDGQPYEAFNTSGGIGNFANQYAHRVRKINYKTIRYPGHNQLMRFLVNDLHLDQRKDVFVDLFKGGVPHTENDVVVISVHVVGKHVGATMPTRYEYVAKIYPHIHPLTNECTSAIQVTTAAGLCIALDWWATGAWKGTKYEDNTFFGSEMISWDFLMNCPFSDPYITGALTSVE